MDRRRIHPELLPHFILLRLVRFGSGLRRVTCEGPWARHVLEVIVTFFTGSITPNQDGHYSASPDTPHT